MWFSAFERYRLQTGLTAGKVIAEEQSSDYESGRVQIDSDIWRIRTARITPTKPGAFVAVWRRTLDGRTEPFRSSDGAEGLVVFVTDKSKFGVFTFTHSHLTELGVVQSSRAPGKRGFRVYPSWCTNLNDQAMRTQRAQSTAFADLSE